MRKLYYYTPMVQSTNLRAGMQSNGGVEREKEKLQKTRTEEPN
jgi:hypothetical protein